MKVVIASHNPVKIRAVETALSLQFPECACNLLPVHVDSGVSDQPLSDSETRQGACNRADNARSQQPDADFWVGIEGGIATLDGQLIAFAWMSVLGPGDKRGLARTTSLQLPPAIKALVDQGMELGEANDRVFSTINSKHQGGAFGLLTRGLYTRESVYTEALVMALIPFVNKLY
jgi:inosine/xanthosine triphosphatase